MLDDKLQWIRDRFEGVWQLKRSIKDFTGASDGHFKGQARLWRSLDGLAYHEEGMLSLGDAGALKAERKYFWQIQVPARVEVYFEDGRFFHAFNPNENHWQAEHICAPDHYRVAYEFSGNAQWQSVWDVTGPRKSYCMISNYSR